MKRRIAAPLPIGSATNDPDWFVKACMNERLWRLTMDFVRAVAAEPVCDGRESYCCPHCARIKSARLLVAALDGETT